MKKIMFSLILFAILIAKSGNALPLMDQFKYYGEIIYSSDDEVLGYAINRYNNKKKIVRKEYYNNDGLLLKYTLYDYENGHLLIKETFYDKNRNILKGVQYKYKKGKLWKKIINEDEKKTYIYYDYSFFNHKLIYVIESHYKIDFYDNKNYILKNKSVYTYKDSEKLVEHFRKGPKRKDLGYQFMSAEIYRYYNEKGAISRIFYLDQRRKANKYVEFFYNKDNKKRSAKIKKINYYLFKNSKREWTGLYDFPAKNLTLKQSILYQYSSEPFNDVKGFEKGLFHHNEIDLTPEVDTEKEEKKMPPKTIIKPAEGDKEEGEEGDGEEGDEEEGDEEKGKKKNKKESGKKDTEDTEDTEEGSSNEVVGLKEALVPKGILKADKKEKATQEESNEKKKTSEKDKKKKDIEKKESNKVEENEDN